METANAKSIFMSKAALNSCELCVNDVRAQERATIVARTGLNRRTELNLPKVQQRYEFVSMF